MNGEKFSVFRTVPECAAKQKQSSKQNTRRKAQRQQQLSATASSSKCVRGPRCAHAANGSSSCPDSCYVCYLYLRPSLRARNASTDARDPTRSDLRRPSVRPAMATRVWLTALLLAFLLAASPFTAQVARADSEEDAAAAEVVEGADLGIVGDDTQVSSDGPLSPAPGVETVVVFPKNAGKIVPAGEEIELLVGLQNEGESTLNVVAVHSTLHLPFDHKMYGQNLTVQNFFNASVPVSVQATFPYKFVVSKFLQPGAYDLVGYIVYEIDQHPYQNVFYNGTVEVVEAGGLLSVESVFLITLGIALLGLFGLWAYGQVQQFSKKTKKAPKVELGTGTTDANIDEWLEGTSFAQKSKSKKKQT